MGIVADGGSTAEERSRGYPCDEHSQAGTALYRAIDVAAPPAVVFRWLCQLRAAPYSYDWIDNLGRQSPRTRDPANEQLAPGQVVMVMFRIASFERDRHITLTVPPGRPLAGSAATYQVTPQANGARLVVKVALRVWSPLRWFLALGDLIMMRKQLRTLKALAEQEHARAPVG